MDPATLAFDTATSLTTALNLLFSRLDARRKRADEKPDIADALRRLSYAVLSWTVEAENTDRVLQYWAQGKLEDSQFIIPQVHGQILSYEKVFVLLNTEIDAVGRSDKKRPIRRLHANPRYQNKEEHAWRSLRYILNLYGPEVFEVLTKAGLQRRALVEDLKAQLPALRTEGPEAVQATVDHMHNATVELHNARAALDKYVRQNFPLSLLRIAVLLSRMPTESISFRPFQDREAQGLRQSTIRIARRGHAA